MYARSEDGKTPFDCSTGEQNVALIRTFLDNGYNLHYLDASIRALGAARRTIGPYQLLLYERQRQAEGAVDAFSNSPSGQRLPADVHKTIGDSLMRLSLR